MRKTQNKKSNVPNTYSQIHIHLVFAVKFRRALILPQWKNRLHMYMTGIIQNNGHKLVQINSMPDHLHILIGYKMHQAIPALVQNLKSESTKWINRMGLSKETFAWQKGYGAFSYCKRDLSYVIRYIQNQELRHKKESFLGEYVKMLESFEVDYNPEYLFNELI
ncbi:IS200/IS605 family transposase [Rhodohalobacter mucosus]|uniref:IS200/IS605 family transposase n=1 Tax=Rhodohalobacter mucosus TaxID=2079485 RepID=A0A316TUK8_9BACT|nr:IS200/IS605 family transposase [Rhodohalobacter mucosus]PWN08193.1 IS200/IS605 family transposase [Rhodohalobacter mucosus]